MQVIRSNNENFKHTLSPVAPVSPGRPVGGILVVVVVDLAITSGICTSGQSTFASAFPDRKSTRHFSTIKNVLYGTVAFTAIKTRSSANVNGPRDAPHVRNIALEKASNRGMTFKDTQGHYNNCFY